MHQHCVSPPLTLLLRVGERQTSTRCSTLEGPSPPLPFRRQAALMKPPNTCVVDVEEAWGGVAWLHRRKRCRLSLNQLDYKFAPSPSTAATAAQPSSPLSSLRMAHTLTYFALCCLFISLRPRFTFCNEIMRKIRLSSHWGEYHPPPPKRSRRWTAPAALACQRLAS